MSHRIEQRPIEILMVEDSPSDAQLTIEALSAAKIANHLTHVEDGVDAMNLLRRQGPYSDAPRPDLILLDLNLPRKDGREMLAELKQDPVLKTIPVVVLTTSGAEEDVLFTYDHGVAGYITKPDTFQKLVEIVKGLSRYWSEVVELFHADRMNHRPHDFSKPSAVQ